MIRERGSSSAVHADAPPAPSKRSGRTPTWRWTAVTEHETETLRDVHTQSESARDSVAHVRKIDELTHGKRAGVADAPKWHDDEFGVVRLLIAAASRSHLIASGFTGEPTSAW